MSTLNLAERNFRDLEEMEPEQKLKNLSIQENEDTGAQNQHCSLVKQITFSSSQSCNIRPSTFLDTFDSTHVNGSHNDINADSDNYGERKEYNDKNKNLEHELKRNLLTHYQPNNDSSEVSDTAGSLEVSKELYNKGTSNSLKDNLVKQELDSALPSCHAGKESYQHYKNSNNSLGVEMKYEHLINDNSSHNSNGISGPKLLDACSGLPVSGDTVQSHAQGVTCADDGNVEIAPINKETFPSNDTACISYSYPPRSPNKESSIPFSSSHESKDTHTLNLKPIQYFDSSEVSDVKEKLANTDDNLNLESSSIREETVDINTSCRSSDFQSECDEHSCAYNLTPLQCSNNAAVVSVKQVILGYASGMDVKDSREMLSVSNISCASYNLRSRNDRDSGSERVSSRYKEDTRIFVSASSENCKSHSVDDMLVKQSPTYQMISSRSYNLCSRNWYYNLRKRGVNLKVKKEIDSEENYKKQKYYKKISGYNLRPRNTHTGKLASGSRGTCLFNYNPNRHYLQVKKINDAQVENQSMISTNMSCGTYNLRPRNSPGSGSIHKEGPRICLSGLGIRCKSENVEDILVKQETSVCDDDNFSSPTSNCEKSCLHNCSGVQVKQNTVTRGGYSQIKNEIFISSSDVSCKTYNLRPRTNQGDCSELVSLQHKKGTKICSSNSGHSLKSDSAQDRKVRGEVKQETIVCDVDSLSYNVCSGVQYQKVGGMGADMKLINDKNNKPKFCGERSPYKLRNHCRNDYYKYNESELHKNNYIKSAEIVAAEGIIPRINVNCSQFCEETQNLEENASVGNSMHVISEVTSSERSVSYDLRSRCIIKEILHKELAFRKDTKEEKGSEAENTLFETSRTVPGESIPIKSSKNVNGEHLEQRLAGIKGIWPPSVNNPVTTTEIHNLGNVGFMNDSKSGCTKESFYEDLKQEIVAKCADGITSVQESSVIGINETNLDELICLRSERQVQKNVGNQKHCIFHNKSPELEFLQNCQSHESCIGQDGLQVFGDKKHSEEIDCFEINTVDLHPSGIRSDFEPCEELDIGTEPCLLSAHSGCLNNSVAQSEKVQIDFVEHPDAHDENIGGVSSQTDILSYDSLNDLGDSHTGCEKLNNQDLFITETLRGLVCNENNAESAGTLQDTKEFPCNETSFVQDATSTWQQTISDTDNSIHKEQDLLLASNVNMTNDQQLFQTDNNSMIREQNLICIDNTNIAEKQKYVGDISHTQSCGGHSKGLLNTGNDPKGSGIIYETDNFLTAVDVDVNGTNTIEISVPQKAGNDCKKSDISVPVEMPLPEIGDALTAEDFNMDGPNTLKISDARKSLFTEDDGDRIPDATDSQDRNVSDVDMVELCMSIPVLKLSLVDGPVPRFGAETVKEASKDSEMAANEAEGENMIPNPYKGVGLMVKTLSGHVVEIKVDQDRPKSFKNEKARMMWDEAVYRNALRLKTQIERGEVIPDDIKKQIDHKIQMKEEEKSSLRKDRKKNKLKWLKLEARLVELDALVKSNLSLTKADPDCCLAHLDEISTLTIDPLMLKKHPQVVETIKKLRRYIGNMAEWNYTEEQKAKFATKAGQIRDKADHIYNRLKTMFTVPEGRTFWQAFADHVTLFKQHTSHLSPDKLYSLTVDPVVSKNNAESGSSEEEQTKNCSSKDEGALEDSEGEEENRAPELKKLPCRVEASRR